MRRGWKIAALAALAMVVLSTAAVGALVVRAQSSSDSGTFNFRDELKKALANVLGITVEQYDAAVDKAEQTTLDKAVTDGWLTKKQADAMKERLAAQPHDKGFPGRPGFPGKGRGEWGAPGAGCGIEHGSLLSTAAEVLGVQESELITALRDGKSIADVAKEKNIATQTIVDKYVASVKAELDQAVKDEQITQKVADAMLARAQESAAAQVNQVGGAGWRHGLEGRPKRGATPTPTGSTT